MDASFSKTRLLADIMLYTHTRQHAAAKFVLNCQRDIQNSKLAKSYFHINNRPQVKKFGIDVKRLNAFSANPVAYNVINKHNDPAAIANDVKNVYKDIFHARITSEHKVLEMRCLLNFKCNNFKWQHFSPGETFMACMQLKPDKKDADKKPNSSAFTNAP